MAEAKERGEAMDDVGGNEKDGKAGSSSSSDSSAREITPLQDVMDSDDDGIDGLAGLAAMSAFDNKVRGCAGRLRSHMCPALWGACGSVVLERWFDTHWLQRCP